MIATRADIALIFRAISSEREIILEALIPGAGCNSYIVTIGPGETFIISPSILKSVNTLLSCSAFKFNSSCQLYSLLISGFDKNLCQELYKNYLQNVSHLEDLLLISFFSMNDDTV